MNQASNPIVERLFFTKVYRENKKYFWFFLFFFVLLVSIPAFLHRGISPVFRGWGLFKDKQYVQPSYGNLKVIVNDDTTLQLPNNYMTGGLLSGNIGFYSNFIKTKKDNQRITYRKALDVFFPGYTKQEINSLKDTSKFQDWYKNYLSKAMHIPIKKVAVFEQTIIYDQNDFAALKSYKLLYTF
ncbi:MAG: hypothetical protein PW786_14540 [Arachidicoccus sp.]|nr:hypothetical protein [Arachidicoccus sp.]